jgi:heterodisulfide reductase subunit A-like polyferredoxin
MKILFCQCDRDAVIPPEARKEIASALAARPGAVMVDDLCAAAARHDPILAECAASERLVVAACHPRAVRWLFRWAGAPLDETRVTFLDLRRLTPAETLAAIGANSPATAGATGTVVTQDSGQDWKPWFPVIDEARCRHCRQCLSFCLFGVYALSPDGKVVVQNPANCKNNCPACARICPEVAIMFPKLSGDEAPLNGDNISDEASMKARARINAGEILGDDIYAALAERRKEARRRRLKRPAAEQAEAERAAHLPESTP